MRFHPHSCRASVVLVALCCVTVLGFGLASYLVISSQAMKLANRSHAGNVSGQLAEIGLEEALRSINKNDWSGWSNGGASATWQDVDATTKKGTLTFPAGKFGAGITGSVNVQVQNYNSAQLDSAPWNNLTTYQLNDLVSDNGVWYRSVRSGNQGKSTSKLGWWVPAPIPWAWSPDISYSKGDLVNHKGIWFRCEASYIAGLPPVSAGPAPYPAVPVIAPLEWTNNTDYAASDVIKEEPSGLWYACTAAHHSGSSFLSDRATYWSSIPKDWKPLIESQPWTSASYIEREVVSYKEKIYRCINSTASDPDNITDWTSDLTAISLPWDFEIEYSKGALVFYSGDWYSCTKSHKSTDPAELSDSLKWAIVTTTPEIAWKWKASTHEFNDVVYYGTPGRWYRCKAVKPSGVAPTTGTNPDWENALSGGAHGWNAGGINYNLGDVIYYDITTQWYRCIQAHTSSGSLTPASTAYWSAIVGRTNRWDSTRTYAANDTVSYNGVWYLCLSSNSRRTPPTLSPFYDSYWASAVDTTRQWNATTAYTSGSYCSYGGAWYKCIAGTAAHQSPNDSAFWTPSWLNSSGITDGAPVILAEGTSTLTEGVPIKTILRGTIAPTSLFPNAAAAITTLTINGGSGVIDSYDSTLPTSAFPLSSYDSQRNTATNYSATLAAGSTSSLALTIGNGADVRGYLAWPSPPAGIGTSVTVKGFTSPSSPNVDPARVSRSPYIPQADPLPRSGLLADDFPKGIQIPPRDPFGPSILNLGTAGGTTPSRYYYDGDLRLQTGSGYYSTININGPVILHIRGFLRIQSGGLVDIKDTGSAEIHYAKNLRTDTNSHGILNRTLDPKKLTVIVDPSLSNSTSIRNGDTTGTYNNNFYGTIYANNPTFSSRVEVRTGVNFYGAISAKEVAFTAEANLHYDTALRYTPISGVDAPYSITDWRELTDPAEKVTLTP